MVLEYLGQHLVAPASRTTNAAIHLGQLALGSHDQVLGVARLEQLVKGLPRGEPLGRGHNLLVQHLLHVKPIQARLSFLHQLDCHALFSIVLGGLVVWVQKLAHADLLGFLDQQVLLLHQVVYLGQQQELLGRTLLNDARLLLLSFSSAPGLFLLALEFVVVVDVQLFAVLTYLGALVGQLDPRFFYGFSCELARLRVFVNGSLLQHVVKA